MSKPNSTEVAVWAAILNSISLAPGAWSELLAAQPAEVMNILKAAVCRSVAVETLTAREQEIADTLYELLSDAMVTPETQEKATIQ